MPEPASRPADRAASSTAVLVCQGRATAHGRYAVGRFSDPVAHALLDPHERQVVDQVRAGEVPTDASERLAYEMVRHTGTTMVPRTVAIDDAIRAAAADQLVLLGAGLDARGWRMPELHATTVFEVDHPASQRDKLRRVDGLEPTAGRVVPVAIDLSAEPVAPALEAAGFERDAVTTWVWEGVVPYLPADAVRSTVAQVADLSAPGTTLVVSYQARSLTASAGRAAMRLVLRISRSTDPLAGEPWRSLWSPDGMRQVLGRGRFDVTADDDLLTLGEGLELPMGDARSLRNGRVAVATRR
jgi:methyltransferase (TIGR00027 family)